ncbi:MAG: aminotransferase class I/II-fold pyridoxal phosphate-dependent enzyme [Acidimicrobiales bacterium]
MWPQPSSRSGIDPFLVMELMHAAQQRAEAGDDVLHLEVGQPATPAPKGVIAAAHLALDNEVLGYTTARGIPELRKLIASHYDDWYGESVDPNQVIITTGATGAFVLSFLAAFDPGDRVVVPSPGYPCYRNALSAFDVQVVDLPTTLDTKFQPTPELLEPLLPLDGLVVASPSNPAGTMIAAADMTELANFCEAHQIRFVSDEIYHGITYGESATTALACAPSSIVVQSFSKYFSMTGWRLGWVIAPDDLTIPIERLGQNLAISAPTLSQVAACAAFDCHDELQANISRYSRNRQLLLEGLPKAGMDLLAPADGAFYIYADVSHMGIDSRDLSARWLSEIGVAASSGVDFDPTRGHEFIRFSYAGSAAEISEAVLRLQSWV